MIITWFIHVAANTRRLGLSRMFKTFQLILGLCSCFPGKSSLPCCIFYRFTEHHSLLGIKRKTNGKSQQDPPHLSWSHQALQFRLLDSFSHILIQNCFGHLCSLKSKFCLNHLIQSMLLFILMKEKVYLSQCNVESHYRTIRFNLPHYKRFIKLQEK